MLESLIGVLGSSAGGAIFGVVQSFFAARSDAVEKEKERSHQRRLAESKNAVAFQRQLGYSSSGVKKITVKKSEFYVFGLKFGRASDKVSYKVIGAPANFHRAVVIWMYAFIQCAVALMFAAQPDITLHSFAATPDRTSWSLLFGLIGYTKEADKIYTLTTGGLILPLFYHISFIISKWAVGAWKK